MVFHKRKPYTYAEFAPQGELLALHLKGITAKGGGERGDIKAFSRQSRSRLMRRIATMKKYVIPLFVTLTYPDQFPTEFEVYKNDLHKVFEALRYHNPDFGAIWRLEFQNRGAPHYHILLYGVSLEQAEVVIPKLWFKIAGRGDNNHLLFHTGKLERSQHCVQEIRSWNGVKSYAAKYLGKLPETQEMAGTGRFWGAVGELPVSHILTMRIDMEVALQFRRAFRTCSGMKTKRFGFWAYGYHVDWLRWIDETQTIHEERNIPENFPPGWYRSIRPVVLEDTFEQ